MNKILEPVNKWFGLAFTIFVTIREFFVWSKDSWWLLAIIWMVCTVKYLEPWNREKWDKLSKDTAKKAADDGSWEKLKNQTFVGDPQNPDSYKFSFYEDEKGNKKMGIHL